MYEINKKRLVKRFVDLVKIPSPSFQEHGIIEYIEKDLKPLKIKIHRYKCKDSFNLLAKVNGNSKKPALLFSCHMDTVTPCESVKPVVTDTKIASDGSTVLGSDDKAAVAAFLEVIHYIKENEIAHGQLEFLFSCAEEIGLFGIKEFDLSIIDAKYAFVFDSGGNIGHIITSAPYHMTMDVTIRGKAAHAGIEPEKGINAIRVASEIINAIPHGRIDSETTANVGVISGGKATNIVAEEASFKLEWRSIDKKKLEGITKKIVNTIKEISKKRQAKCIIKKQLEYSGFSVSINEKIIRIVDSAVRRLNIKPVYEVSGGGSDTNVITRAGIKALNLSIGMRNVHTSKEYILKKDLVNGTRLILSIIDSV